MFIIQEGELGATNEEVFTNLVISVGRHLSFLEILTIGEVVECILSILGQKCYTSSFQVVKSAIWAAWSCLPGREGFDKAAVGFLSLFLSV